MNGSADNLLRGGRTGLWATAGLIIAERLDSWVGLTSVEQGFVSVAAAALVAWIVNEVEDRVNSKTLVPKDRSTGDKVLEGKAP